MSESWYVVPARGLLHKAGSAVTDFDVERRLLVWAPRLRSVASSAGDWSRRPAPPSLPRRTWGRRRRVLEPVDEGDGVDVRREVALG